MRVAQKQGLGACPECLVDRVEVVCPAAVRGGARHFDNRMAECRQQRQHGHVGGRGHDHSTARRSVRANRDRECGQHVRDCVHPLGGNLPAAGVAEPPCPRIRVLRCERIGKVAEGACVDGSVQGSRDDGGCAEVGLCDPGADGAGVEAPFTGLGAIEVGASDLVVGVQLTVGHGSRFAPRGTRRQRCATQSVTLHPQVEVEIHAASAWAARSVVASRLKV